MDIVNRGLQLLGALRVVALTDNSKNAAEANFIYDKCRRAELRANLWNFSARRHVLRPFVPGVTKFFVPATWDPTLSYPIPGTLIFYNGINWVANVPIAPNSAPGATSPHAGWMEFTAPEFFGTYAPNTTYYPGEVVFYNSQVYITSAATTALPPLTPWVELSVFYIGVPFYFPQGLTTNTLSAPKNVFPLPVGYLRVMPQDPKSSATPAQLSTAGMQTLDYEFEAGFVYTAQQPPFVFRYVADLQNVLWFDDLFCEALATRIALGLNETITQSPQKAQILNGLYEEAIAKAIRVNAIEAGSTEPDTDKVDSQRGPTRERLPPQPRQQ